MVNSKHSGKLKSTRKIGIHSISRNRNDSQATPVRSGINEDRKPFKETVKKTYLKKTMNENHSSILLTTLSERNLKFTGIT